MNGDEATRQLNVDLDAQELSGLGAYGTLFDQIADFMKTDNAESNAEESFLGSFHHDLALASTGGFGLETDGLSELLTSLSLEPQDPGDAPETVPAGQFTDMLTAALKQIDEHQFLRPPSVPRQATGTRPRPSPLPPSTAAKPSQTASTQTAAAAPTHFHQHAKVLPDGSVGAAAPAQRGSSTLESEAPPASLPDDVSFADSIAATASSASNDRGVASASILHDDGSDEAPLSLDDLTGAAAAAAAAGTEVPVEETDDTSSQGSDEDVLGGEVGDLSEDGVPLGWLPPEAQRQPGQGYDRRREDGDSDLSRATPEQLAMHNDVMRKLAASVLGSEQAAAEFLDSAAKLRPPRVASGGAAASTGDVLVSEAELD